MPGDFDVSDADYERDVREDCPWKCRDDATHCICREISKSMCSTEFVEEPPRDAQPARLSGEVL